MRRRSERRMNGSRRVDWRTQRLKNFVPFGFRYRLRRRGSGRRWRNGWRMLGRTRPQGTGLGRRGVVSYWSAQRRLHGSGWTRRFGRHRFCLRLRLFFWGFSHSNRSFRVFGMFHRLSGRFSGARLPVHFAVLAKEPMPYRKRNILVDRAGMRLFFAHPKFRKEIENDAGLNFQFPGQLVNPNFLHTGNC